MRVACLQFCPEFKNLDANTNIIIDAVRSANADVFIAPELATSGYFFQSRNELRDVAQGLDGEHSRAIIEVARETNTVVVCGFAEADGNSLYNSALIAGPEITPHTYRKTHLFYKERLCFDPGNSGFYCTPLPHLDCTLGTMICYDWRFPESARALALQGADLVVCPSNLVTHLWRMAMPVRAMENKVFLAVANRTGSEESHAETVSFNGCSAVYDTNGGTLVEANATETSVIITEIDPASARTKSFNAINDIFADRRPELYTR